MTGTSTRWAGICVCALVIACGSKTGLKVPEPGDAAMDAGPPPLDATFDTGVDGFMPPPEPDECVELPYDEPPRFVDVRFLARIQSADVLLLVDVTGSMSDEIAQIRSSLRDVLIPGMAAAIPDLQIAVASFADFNVPPYGAVGDRAYTMLQRTTADLDAVETAVTRLRESGGGDGPESQVEALYQSATGAGRGRYIPNGSCAPGLVGYPCFRSGGSRVILLFTDADFHNGPGGSQPYAPGDITPTPASYEDAVNALRDIGAKVLGLFSGGGSRTALSDMQSIARDTGAVTPAGEPIVFDIGTRGEALDEGVIDSVRTLVEEVPLDIDVLLEDWPGDDVDATEFVRRVRALRAQPPGGAVQLDDRFEMVRPGTRVTFRLSLANDLLPAPADEPQVYYLTVVLRGDGATRLSETVVAIVIPTRRMEVCEDLFTP